jgi:ankyrin repeat protein
MAESSSKFSLPPRNPRVKRLPPIIRRKSLPDQMLGPIKHISLEGKTFAELLELWHISLATNNVVSISSILKKNMNFVSFVDTYKRTAFHIAACKDDIPLAAVLSSSIKNADPPITAPFQLLDDNGHTPMYYCGINANLCILKIYKKMGADVHQPVDTKHNTLLHLAGKRGCRPMIKFLLDSGLELTPNREGDTAIDVTKNVSCRDLLLDHFETPEEDPADNFDGPSFDERSFAEEVIMGLKTLPLSLRRSPSG